MTLGIDEVGRGSLAGPVVLAGVLLDDSYPLVCDHVESFKGNKFKALDFVRDSKKLKLLKRLEVTQIATQLKIPNLILSASPALIDEYGIGVCLSYLNLLVISYFTEKFSFKNVLIDGKIKLVDASNEVLINKLILENNLEIKKLLDLQNFVSSRSLFSSQEFSIVRENFADDKYLSIALASNLAKVFRDNLMTKLASQYPNFDWGKNKGYGTLKHRQAILRETKNEHLRQSFLTRILITKNAGENKLHLASELPHTNPILTAQ